MDQARLATMFKALGDPTRLAIFEFLCRCANVVSVDEQGDMRPMLGPTVGAVCCQVTGIDKITSTMSFHLKELRQAGLIAMERQGKQMICMVNRSAIDALEAFFANSKIPLAADAECCEVTE